MSKKIILCNCGGERISQERIYTIEQELVRSNMDVIMISDLCRMSALHKEKLCEIFRKDGEYLVIGCYERTMKLLLEQAEPAVSVDNLQFVNFLESTDEEITRAVTSATSTEVSQNSSQTGSMEEVTTPSDWPSWFPVIDYSRCTACGQCADFCLFGVYDKTSERVTVTNPQGCKYNCPACARICPQTAIIFPKYKSGDAIGGSGFIDEISEQKRQTEDINSILGGDIYHALEKRKLKRRSIILDEALNKAIEERKDALLQS